uniref:Si:dkey-201i24.3 n=1 Tax=Astyanax mexicanus TaxID=7994 RepID=A0A3B1IMU7_ASTMX
MEMHIKGRASVERNQERVERIRKLKEELHREEKTQKESEGAEGEVIYLNRERQILVLQIEALRRENQQAEEGLEAQYRLHQQEVHSLREESLQVFRTFRQVLEEQKRLSEGRYRTLLLEAIQDAVHLSTLNQQLQTENKQL